MKPQLIYLCDANLGGIYEYALRQSAALVEAGVAVTFLCRKDFPGEPRGVEHVERRLPPKAGARQARLLRFWEAVRTERAAACAAYALGGERGTSQTLGACYREYFSPLWAGAFRHAQRGGVRFSTIAHDPVRDFVLGPRWWHRWSVAQAYSFVSQVFTHDDTPLDTGRPCPHLQVTVIPHGPYELPPPKAGRSAVRERYGFADGDVVLLAFGHVRDSKNLDLVLRALTRLPIEMKLLVAGKENAVSQRPVSHYQRLASELGIGKRCRWEARYILNDEAADFFAAADVCLLTYGTNFRSASGVLNTAVFSRRMVLASSGSGPLGSVVQRYGLGVLVAPESVDAIVVGLGDLLSRPPVPQWEQYARENSWRRNADLVRKALFGSVEAGAGS